MFLKDLRLYQECCDFAEKIWNIVALWNYFEKDTIGKQLVGSADSISQNIAEGYGRFHYKENKQFCFYARGSLVETQGWIQKSFKRKLIEEKAHQELISELEILHKKLNAYIKSIGTAESKVES